jgi:hypothetical protein
MSSNGVNSLAVLARTVQQQPPYTADDHYNNSSRDQHYDSYHMGPGNSRSSSSRPPPAPPAAPYSYSYSSGRRFNGSSMSYDSDDDAGESVDMELELTPPPSPISPAQAQQQELQDEPDELALPPLVPLLVGTAASADGQPWSSNAVSSTCCYNTYFRHVQAPRYQCLHASCPLAEHSKGDTAVHCGTRVWQHCSIDGTCMQHTTVLLSQ